jgi:hypothetical protein
MAETGALAAMAGWVAMAEEEAMAVTVLFAVVS